jgi:L-alanine-DL-glutamate epimerase-like enolase superfamily enzyme
MTQTIRSAAMASAHKLEIHPHTSMTGLNMAASIHFLAALAAGDAWAKVVTDAGVKAE